MQLTVREAAKFLNVSEKTLYRWAGEGGIPVYRVNGQYRFNHAELLEWATSRNMEVSTKVFRPEGDVSSIPTVADALRAGGIFYKLPGTDKNSVLRAMVDSLKLPDRVDRETLYEILLAREASGTTGVGGGIAIPHVRNPIVLNVTAATITLFFLEKPIDFAAPDKKPVHTLFWLVSPIIRAHMLLLSRLASVVRDPGFKAALGRQAPAEEILNEGRRVESSLGPSPGGGPK